MKLKLIEIISAFFDCFYFFKYSFRSGELKNKSQYIAYLTKQQHIIEKGMTLPSPRVGFGEKKIKMLMNELSKYINKYGEDKLTQNIVSALKDYILFNSENNFASNFIEEISVFVNKKLVDETGGRKVANKISNKGYWNSFEEFFKGRKSIRNFEKSEINDSIILKAVDIAKYSPSVCNRQGWRVHLFKGDDIQKILKYQNGNTGFTDSIGSLAVVTGDISYYTTFERNQIGIDSGIFSMSFILALHSLGLGTCALNACSSFSTEKKVKEIASIPYNEKIIMYIAIGDIKNEYYVAKSERRETRSFITFHNSYNSEIE